MASNTGSANSANTAIDPWEPPVPLDDFDPPPFPTHVLPDWLRDFVEAEAVATQTPPDLAGMLVLAAVAAASARYAVVEVKDGWREPVNLYLIPVLGSANRKSAVHRAVVAPIEEAERRAAAESRDEIVTGREWKGVLERRLKVARKAFDEGGSFDDLREAAEEVDRFKVPVSPRLIADDVTSEKLEILLDEQGGRMAVLAAEGDVFDVLMGRYSQSGITNISVFNKAHPGDPIRVDRVNRPSVIIDHPALTIGLAVQPHVVDGLAARREFAGRGLLARFLYSLPHSTVGRRDGNPPPISDQIRSHYDQNLTRLLELEWAGKDGKYQPQILELEDDARDALRGFSDMVEHELGLGGSLTEILAWGGKLVGAVARLAANLHLADHTHADKPWSIPITAAVMSRAIELGLYLVPHARAAFALMGADPAVGDAKHILNWIIGKRHTEFTKRDLFEGVKGRFKKVDNLKPGLALLEDHEYIRLRVLSPKRRGPGRPRSPVYEVNPSVPSQYSQNTQNPG